jgi:hypothetical protein
MSGGWGITPEQQPEFDAISAVAITLVIRNRKKKAEKVKKIKKIGDKYQIEPIKSISKNDIYNYDLRRLLNLKVESDE